MVRGVWVRGAWVRGAAFFLLCFAASGQVRQVDPLQADPLQAKLEAIYKAQREGRFTDATALREGVRQMLVSLPVDAPQFGGWVQSVAQLYIAGGRTAQARAVLQTALDRAATLGAASPVRIQLLTSLSDSLRADRNLLKAAEYLEKAVAAMESAPAEQPAVPPVAGQWFIASGAGRWVSASRAGVRQVNGNFSRFPGGGNNLSNLYQRLADLQQQLGRPDAAAALHAKIRALAAKEGDQALAGYFEQHGQLAEAAASYKAAAERAATPQEAVNALQSLSNIYVREERVDDALTVQRQAIARMEAAGTPDLNGQSMGARQTLARILQQAGRVDQADAVYQELLAGGRAEQQWQLVFNYAGYLSSTQRAAQATALLKQFQATHSPQQPWEESGLFSALANAARASGDSKQAEEYQALAVSEQPPAAPEPAGQPSLDGLFQKAQAAASAGRTDEAFELAMQALDAAPRAQNREQVGWQVQSVAGSLVSGKSAANAEQLYHRALGLAEGWSEDTLQPLLNLVPNYARFLIMQRERRAEVPAAIERYRNLLIAAHGADSGSLDEALRMTIEFERTRTPPPVSLIPAQDLLAFEESANGNTSEPYLRALQMLAQAYDHNGDRERAIPVRRRIVQIADLVFRADDQQRGQARVDLAMALANQGQFDEAERLVAEAASLQQAAKQYGDSLGHTLLHIRQMRAAATAAKK